MGSSDEDPESMQADTLPATTREKPASHANDHKKVYHMRRLKAFLHEDVQPTALLEFELMLCAFASGINDATMYTDYRVFVSNQTGNTALLGVQALGLVSHSIDLRDVAISISLFIVGGFVLGQAGNHFGSQRRGWLFFTNTVQVVMIFIAASLRKWYAHETFVASHGDPRRFAVSAFLAFASGGQVAMARTVGVPEIPTGMVTRAYVDLLTDPELFAWKNRPRDRRLQFVFALLAGSFAGASAYRYVGPPFAIFVAGLAKTIIIPLLFFNQAKKIEAF